MIAQEAVDQETLDPDNERRGDGQGDEGQEMMNLGVMEQDSMDREMITLEAVDR